jgi:hypothetical protein
MKPAKQFTQSATLSKSLPTERPIYRFDGGLNRKRYGSFLARSGDVVLGKFQSFFDGLGFSLGLSGVGSHIPTLGKVNQHFPTDDQF